MRLPGMRSPSPFVRGLRLAVVALALFAGGGAANAMRLSPMVAEIAVAGAGSSARIEIGNDGASPLPFETHITRIEIDEHGAVKETPADDDFLVFPPQGIVGAQGRQTIRIQWLGDPQLYASRSYFLEVRQIPVALDADPAAGAGKPVARLQINYRIKALITVSPKGAKSRVSVVSVEAAMIDPPSRPTGVDAAHVPANAAPAAAAAKVPGLRVTLTNAGERHALMGGVNWILDGTGPDGKPLHETMLAGKVIALIGVGYLPPDGGRRIFDIPLDEPFKGPVTIRFTE